MKEPGRVRIKGYLIYVAGTMALALVLLLMARKLPGFGEWYARHVFPVFPHTLGRLAALAPFSFFEVIVLGLALIFFILIIRGFLRLLAPRRRTLGKSGKAAALALFSSVLKLSCWLSTLFLFFVLTCGINYHRDTFAQQTGLEIRASSAGELRQLYRLLLEQVEGLAEDLRIEPAIEADSQQLLAETYPLPDNQKLDGIAKETMEELSAAYPGLISYYPRTKPVYFSKLMSRCQLGGFYSNWTMEANYNRHMPLINRPFTLCHELAHLSGFAREDEANFVGYLACRQSGDPYFRYSGAFYALRYTLNALYGAVETEEYSELYDRLPWWVSRELEENRLYWQSFEGKTSEIYWAANDSYLKANKQADGMQSYGRMVDLLLAYYRHTGELEQYSASPQPLLPEVDLTAADFYSSNVVLADRETGTILFSKGGDLPAEPASVTKILTAITAIEMIEDLDAQVTMQKQDFTGLYESNAALSGFKVGEKVSYRDLLYTLMLVSGCDSAYALANNLSGSLPAFARVMNEKAAELGLTGSHFVDPSGLTAPDHYTTAADTVKILDYALKNPLFRQIFESRTYAVPATNLSAEEREIRNIYFFRLNKDFEGEYLANGVHLLGGKTGFTNAAGLCLATGGECHGREYLAVIFGGPGSNKTPQYNFMDALTLFGAL